MKKDSSGFIRELLRQVGEHIEAIGSAEVQVDEDGKAIVELARDGECGLTWNDAAIGTWTPAPSARCPYEPIHEEIATLRKLRAFRIIRNRSQIEDQTSTQTEGLIAECAETRKLFAIHCDGFTFNYASGRDGTLYSDEGVNIRERRELLDRSKPFGCYVSSDGKHVTGWKGNVLGDVRQSWGTKRRAWCGGTANFYRVRDIHGGEWTGYGSPGMCITLRAVRERRTAA